MEPFCRGITCCVPAGIGNSTIGSVIADFGKYALTNKENLPATKGDIKKIENKLKRYQKIKHIPEIPIGYIPYFDLETKEIVVFKNQILELPDFI